MLNQFYPRTIENRAALRTAIAAVIAILIAFKFHFDTPYWAGMTVVIVANLYTGSIIDKAILRIIGTIAGAWGGYFLAGLIVNSFSLFLLANFLLVGIASYYFIFSRYAYAFLLAGISGFIVVAQLAVDPDNTLVVAIWRPIEIGVGVVVSALTAFCLFPNKIQHSLEEQIHSLFNLLKQQFSLFEESLLNNPKPSPALLKNNLQLKRNLRKAADMIGFLRREVGIKRERIDQFRAMIDLMYALSRSLNYYIISLSNTSLNDYERTSLPTIFQALKKDLSNIESLFFNSPEVSSTTTTTAEKIQQWSKNYPEQSSKNYKLHGLFKQASSALTRMEHVLSGEETWNPQQYFLSSQTRLSHDPDVIIYGTKVGLSAVLALLFWLLSNWPGGLNGIISSIVISIKKNSFEMKNTSIHRLIGCFLGGGVALASLFLVEMNLYDFIVLTLFSLWVFNYYAFKYPKYAYIGLQASIALIITLAQPGPPVDLSPPLERLGGVVIGIISSYIVANIWRNAPLSMLNGKLYKLFRLLRYNLSQILTQDRETIKIHDVTNLFWVCRGLIETLGNLELSAKKQQLLESYSAVFDELVIVQATLSHIFLGIDRKEAAKTAEQFGIDLHQFEQDIIAIYAEMEPVNSTLELELQYKVQAIRSNGGTLVAEPEFLNLLAYLNTLMELLRHQSLREIFKMLAIVDKQSVSLNPSTAK